MNPSWSQLIGNNPEIRSADLPMVRSWTGWNLLSVNCSSRHDFPTPERHTHTQTQLRLRITHLVSQMSACQCVKEGGGSFSPWRRRTHVKWFRFYGLKCYRHLSLHHPLWSSLPQQGAVDREPSQLCSQLFARHLTICSSITPRQLSDIFKSKRLINGRIGAFPASVDENNQRLSNE